MANLVTYGRRAATITAREAEVPLADFDNGMNLAASNAPGIGICTDVIDPKLDDWTVLDQAGNARTPQNTQHLGGNGLGAGDATTFACRVIIGDQSGDGDLVGVDGNDEPHFVEAGAVAAPGQGVLAGNTGPINRSSVTVQIGERIWAVDAVA